MEFPSRPEFDKGWSETGVLGCAIRFLSLSLSWEIHTHRTALLSCQDVTEIYHTQTS